MKYKRPTRTSCWTLRSWFGDSGRGCQLVTEEFRRIVIISCGCAASCWSVFAKSGRVVVRCAGQFSFFNEIFSHTPWKFFSVMKFSPTHFFGKIFDLFKSFLSGEINFPHTVYHSTQPPRVLYRILFRILQFVLYTVYTVCTVVCCTAVCTQ